VTDPAAEDAALEAQALAALKSALGLASIVLPHLAELVAVVRFRADARVGTAAVSSTGVLLVHPLWFTRLAPQDAAFVAAHELMHLALRSHDRAEGMDHEIANWAHDCIINDMLAEAFGCDVPASGLAMPGARHLSLEELAKKIGDMIGQGQRPRSWDGAPPAPGGALGAALRKAGRAAPRSSHCAGFPDHLRHDVLSEAEERALFPEDSPARREVAAQRVREAAARSVSLSLLAAAIDEAFFPRGAARGAGEVIVEALETAYRPPWQEALQTWMESVTPGPRTYARASRRGADRADVVLAGRRREGFILHIVLDTSGSMAYEFPRIAGVIRSFCESVGVRDVHLLQCDADVSRDELLDIETFATLTITGLGGSDLSPALRRLANDPEVLAAIVLTDGDIAYPAEPMPYSILWALTIANLGFKPSYGRVLPLTP
jgi:predicted metal-dependent peptidase